MTDLIAVVRQFCDQVVNNRTPQTIFNHMLTEVDELRIELPSNDGPDGVVGESVDIILCALDLIFQHSPDVTDEQIVAIAARKCEKWRIKYGAI
jgi:hypothetical protein